VNLLGEWFALVALDELDVVLRLQASAARRDTLEFFRFQSAARNASRFNALMTGPLGSLG